MPVQSKQEILDEIAQQRGRHAKLGRKLRTNRDRNWLLALTLNSFAKVADGMDPNELDSIIVTAFEKAGFGDEMLEHGRLYGRMTARTRQELFPGAFGTLSPHADYSLTDLKRDLPHLDAAIRSMPNAVDVDVAAVHQGLAHLDDTRRPTRAVISRHAGELLRAVQPDSAGATPADAESTYTIKATQFRCNDETGTDFLGSDEPYWIFGSLGAGTAVTTRSHVFGDIDSGDTASFGASEGGIWGQNGAAQPLPEGEIGALVQLWEHDEGDPEKVKQGVAAAFAAAAGILAATGVAAWIAAVVSGVGAVVQWLLGFLNDDHIADQTFVFTRQTIIDQTGKVGSSFDLTRRFTDGDGDYTLTLRVSHVS